MHLRSEVGQKFEVAFGALSGSTLELDHTLAEASETWERSELDLMLVQRAQARAAAGLERRPAMLATLLKPSKEVTRGDVGVTGGGAGRAQAMSSKETVNSLGTVLEKGCSSRMREFADDKAGNEGAGSKGSNGSGRARYLSVVQLLQAALPSSMRLRTLERECLSLCVQIAVPSSLAGWRQEPLSQRLFLIVALGEDVRVRKLAEMTATEDIEFVFDGVLAEHAL